MVSPRLVPMSNPISGVSDVFNGILVSANMVGEVMFYGPGAGKLPTASAVVADMIDIMEHTPAGIQAPVWVDATSQDVMDFSSYVSQSMVVFDAPLSAANALAQIMGASVVSGQDGSVVVISAPMSEDAMTVALASAGYAVKTRIRLL